MYVITSKQPGDSVPSDINMTVLLAWWHPGSSGALAVSRGPSVHYAHESSAPVTHSRPFCRSSSLSRHGGSFRASASMGGGTGFWGGWSNLTCCCHAGTVSALNSLRKRNDVITTVTPLYLNVSISSVFKCDVSSMHFFRCWCFCAQHLHANLFKNSLFYFYILVL